MALGTGGAGSTRAGLGRGGAVGDRTSGSCGLGVAIIRPRTPSEREAGAGPGAAQAVASFPLSTPSGRSLAAPLEGRRVRVPVGRHGLEPGDDLVGVGRVLAVQGPT